MKFEIIQSIHPIATLGQLEVEETKAHYEYRIDGKAVPPSLARIIELGLAVQMEQYCKGLADEMELIKKLKEGL